MSMISLRAWIIKNARTPLLVAVFLIVLVQIFYLGIIGYLDFNKRVSGIRRLAEITEFGILQKNRSLIEASLLMAMNDFSVKRAGICHGQEVVLSYPVMISDCSRFDAHGALVSVVSIPTAGLSGGLIKYEVPWFVGVRNIVFIVLMSIVFVVSALFLFWKILQKLQNLLLPFQEGLSSDKQLAVHELESLRQKILEWDQLKTQAALGRMAAQVAHDIRSPLAALEAVSGSAAKLPEDERYMLRTAISRIRDIANILVNKNREIGTRGQEVRHGDVRNKDVRYKGHPDAAEIMASTDFTLSTEPFSVVMLSSVTDVLVTEKRAGYASRKNIMIEYMLAGDSYGMFARVQLVELKRLLSNLINNAVEAIEGAGWVSIRTGQNAGKAAILIEDNGKGIPEEISQRLGERGVTFGKAGGSGLGLFHAKKTVESWGGALRMVSHAGSGTVISVELPPEQPPGWFASSINLSGIDQIVAVDDDESIHGIWKKRFASGDPGLVNLYSPEEFETWLAGGCGSSGNSSVGGVNSGGGNDGGRRVFLVDYEFANSKKTGLDLAGVAGVPGAAGIACGQFFLVTSHFENSDIASRCLAMKVKIIPKCMAGFVPVVR